jgi:hypothetical protein
MIRGLTSGVRASVHAHRSDALPILGIAAAVALANLPALLHLVTANPLFLNAYLTPPLHGRLPGLPYIDPNAGYTTQALGHRAALDWLHGQIPWWNPYEGIGSPLAGEMQSGAFFPLTMVLLLHQGMLVLQVSIELISGWSAYALVRRLGVGRVFSTAAGVAFGLCGTYAWLAHAPIRPVAMLPLSLVGVERCLDAARQGRRGGWRLLAIALALSILAGFPETTLIDGVFVALWACLRVAGPDRRFWRSSAVKLGGGLLAGLGLSAPLIVAFADYLPHAATGSLGGAFAYVSLPTAGLAQLVLPYSLGPIFGFHAAHGTDTLSLLWGSVGGFLGVTVVAAGLVGLVGTRLRVLRLGLGGWILVCLLRSYGFYPVVHALAVIPGIRQTAFYRYAPGSWELAVIVLAALGLDDVARAATPRRLLAVAGIVTGALGVWAAVVAWPLLTDAVASSPHQGAHRHVYALGSLAAALLLLAALVTGGWWAGRLPASTTTGPRRPGRRERTRRRGRVVMALAIGVESVGLTAFTYLSAPAPTPLQTGSVAWLQANLGTYRFVTLGPIQPNYGSYYGIAQANIVDLPAPKSYAGYIETSLDPNSPIRLFSGGNAVNPAGLTPAEALTTYLPNYESLGVRYVVEDADGLDLKGKPFPAAGAPAWPAGPRLVYRDGFAEIWQLPAPAAAFSLKPGTGTSGCTVTGRGWDDATVRCSHRVVLVRRVGYFPGWTASAGGHSVEVVRDRGAPGGLLQQVSVPAGKTEVHFSYRPPHEVPAIGAALLAAAAVVASVLVTRLRRAGPAGVAPGGAAAAGGPE